jgi:hypothetical protein
MMFITESVMESHGNATRADRGIVIVAARPRLTSSRTAATDSSIHSAGLPPETVGDGLAVVYEVGFPELPHEVCGADKDTNCDDDGAHNSFLLRTFVRRE